MSGRIDAGIRLFHVAESALAESRTHFDEFINVLSTVTEPAARSAQGRSALDLASEPMGRAMASVAAAKAGARELTAPQSAAIDQAVAGVELYRSQLDQLRKGGNGNVDFDPLGIQTQAEEARVAVNAARNQLRTHADASIAADETIFKAIGDEAKAARNATTAPGKPESFSDSHVDAVIKAASELSSASTRMPKLSEIGVDMVALARQGRYDKLIGRELDVNKLLSVLGQKGKANPVLLGDPGVGKTQLVEGLALRIARGEVPESMRDLQIFSLDSAALMAAAGDNPAEMAKLVKEILEEVGAELRNGGNVAIFFDEVHTLLSVGSVSQQIKPALARGDLKMIGATTWPEFKQSFEKDGALLRRVEPISVEELDKGQVSDVLRSVNESLSKYHGVAATESAIQEVQRLSTRYVSDRRQPDPAITLLDNVLSRVALAWNSGMPPELLAMSNEVDRLKQSVPSFKWQSVLEDTAAGAAEVSANARLAELEPKLAAATTQLAKEREVLGTRFALLEQYRGHLDAGETDLASALEPKLAEALAAVKALRVEYPERMLTDHVDVAAVREAAASLYNRKISAGGAEEADKILRIGEVLGEKIIGQRPATDRIAKALIRVLSGLQKPGKPMGPFLLTGPTGVGKTETVKEITEQLTGDAKNVLRINCQDLMDKHSVSKLIGPPPGYIGYTDPPLLERLFRDPDTVLMFDEAEKAHPDVWNALLSLFDEGQIAIGNKPGNFPGIKIFMTSNLPPDQINRYFSPEMVNRFDGQIEFNALSHDNVSEILTKLHLPKARELMRENGLELEISKEAQDRVATLGFDPEKGARPLNRSIENHIMDPAATMILELKRAGRTLDSGAPQHAILDIDPAGDGFVMRSADGSISVPVEALSPKTHVGGAARADHRALSGASPPGSGASASAAPHALQHEGI